MNLNDQVCALEYSKKLAELGVEQESYFYWYYSIYTREDFKWDLYDHHKLKMIQDKSDQVISAFTSSELGEMLPRTLTWPDGIYGLQQDFYASGDFNIYYYSIINEYSPIDFTDSNEANARAKMLIHLIENKLIEVAK